VRYLRQKDGYSCGPIALMNAIKWSGRKALYTDLKKFQRLCECTARRGCDRISLCKTLRKFFINVKQTIIPKKRDIDQWLKLGNVVLLQYYWAKNRSHFALIVEKTDKTYRCINIYKGKTITNTRTNTLKKYLRPRKDCDIQIPCAFFIRRNESA